MPRPFIAHGSRAGPLTPPPAVHTINAALYKRALLCGAPSRGSTPRSRSEPHLSPSPARIRGTIAAFVDQPDDLRALRIFHKALADVNRLRIVRRLAEAPATVTELIEHVGLSSRW